MMMQLAPMCFSNVGRLAAGVLRLLLSAWLIRGLVFNGC